MVFEVHEEDALVLFSFGENVAFRLVADLLDGVISSRLVTEF